MSRLVDEALKGTGTQSEQADESMDKNVLPMGTNQGETTGAAGGSPYVP